MRHTIRNILTKSATAAAAAGILFTAGGVAHAECEVTTTLAETARVDAANAAVGLGIDLADAFAVAAPGRTTSELAFGGLWPSPGVSPEQPMADMIAFLGELNIPAPVVGYLDSIRQSSDSLLARAATENPSAGLANDFAALVSGPFTPADEAPVGSDQLRAGFGALAIAYNYDLMFARDAVFLGQMTEAEYFDRVDARGDAFRDAAVRLRSERFQLVTLGESSFEETCDDVACAVTATLTVTDASLIDGQTITCSVTADTASEAGEAAVDQATAAYDTRRADVDAWGASMEDIAQTVSDLWKDEHDRTIAPQRTPNGDGRPGYLTGDFDGDGTSDLLITTGDAFLISYSMVTAPVYVSDASANVADMAAADFDGDGADDVFIADGTGWSVSYSGTSPVTRINSLPFLSFPFPRAEVLLGDVNGDGIADVVGTDGNVWMASLGGKSTTPIILGDNQGTTVDDFVIADFDGDRFSDTLLAMNGMWLVRYGNDPMNWHMLASADAAPATAIEVGDFDGDGRDDLLVAQGFTWTVHYAGTDGSVDATGTVVANAPTDAPRFVVDANGDGASDVVLILDDQPFVTFGATSPIQPL